MMKVLIVDDDKLVRKGLLSAMPWTSFSMEVVHDAASGEKALEWLEGNEADILFTDLAMPVMSGIELMREVRRLYPEMYIVVLTLHQNFEYVQEALRLGAIDYIAKIQLEKEHFEEVLGRIRKRIAEEEAKRYDGAARDPGHSSSRMQQPETVNIGSAQPQLPQLPQEGQGHKYSPEVVESIRAAVAIMHAELDQPLYAVDVSRRVNMSRSYFNQCFKDLVGQPFNDYLRWCRIEQAKVYLRETSKPIPWIAGRTGYLDEKYFSRVFRRLTSMLPSEYRQHCRSHRSAPVDER
ncbi:response regulator [Paenibacillus campinasensis]|nr:response regulator [Paenibacillus campinasensis]